MIEPGHSSLSIRRQCELLDLPRSSYYYEPVGESALNLELMRKLDEHHTQVPFYGREKLTEWLIQDGHAVNHKRVGRLMRKMGIFAVCPGPHTSRRHPEHEVYPYLLRGLAVSRPNQVWCADITYIRMCYGFLYLVAVMDWFSRFVLAWRLSNTLDSSFCVEVLEEALGLGRPEIFNTDQGSQFSAGDFTDVLKGAQIRISMDGRGRALDNIFVERLWRSVKYEEVYLHDYQDGDEAHSRLRWYFGFYNGDRFHEALDYRTPREVHYT
jgi:putative transposase